MDTLLDYLAPAGAGFLLVLPFLVDRYLRKAQETVARRKKQAWRSTRAAALSRAAAFLRGVTHPPDCSLSVDKWKFFAHTWSGLKGAGDAVTMTNAMSDKHRSDYGTVRATPRDLALLQWIGEQFAVNTVQLKCLMNRWKRVHEPEWGETSISDETVKWILKRWQRAGWVEHRKLLARQPAWVWLSKTGLADLELDYPPHTPAVGRLSHIYHVNAVRLHVEGRLGEAARWISERQLNVERKAEGKRHLVDGELIYEDTIIGIEVEQTQKSRRRLDSILKELQSDYEAVWYFVADTAGPAVREAIAKCEGTANPNTWRTFVIYPLAEATATDS